MAACGGLAVAAAIPGGKEAGVLRSEFATEGGEQLCRALRGALAMLPTELLA
jgi:hypothetical protein